jgi:hypothetical protein
VNLITSKTSESKVRCPHIATFINILGCLLIKKKHNQIEYILTAMRRHSSVLAVRSFRAADCDTDHYLVVAKVRERLAVNKERLHRFHMERFNFKKLNEVEDKEQYHAEV